MNDKCKRCHADLKDGLAIEQTWVGRTTLSYGGKGKLIPCLKCPKCGWSMTR